MLSTVFGLEGKTCLVTGASKGIGRAVALGYAGAGADVAIAARNETELNTLAAEIRALGRRALVLTADMREIAALPGLVESTVTEFGKLDVLVNNAGIAVRGLLENATAEDFDHMVDVNLKSVFTLSQAAIPHMRKQGGGKIINVTSLTSVIADPGSGIYGMTKGGLTQLTRGFAVELARDRSNIQVNAVGPGPHATTQWKQIMKTEPGIEPLMVARIPIGRVAEPEEIVGAFIFLASNASNFMTGQTLYMDGGWLVS
jgi:2-deoxy-D-gluconate 3-dehydrogenase